MTGKTGYGAAWLASHLAYSSDECLNWPFSWISEGYGRLEVYGRQVRAHRYMCKLAHGKPPRDRPMTAHSCGNRLCVNPQHLRWANRKENASDAKRHGVQPAGSKHGRARLTEEDICDIRGAIGRGTPQKEIARSYGVHP